MKRTVKRFSILTMVLIITVLSAASLSAQAKYMTSFGLQLGEPFNVPECPIVQQTYLGGKRYEDYANDLEIKSMCFKRDLSPYFKKGLLKDSIKKPLPPLPLTGKILLVLPKSRPEYVTSDTVTAYLIGGNFVGIDFLTYGGVKYSDTALDIRFNGKIWQADKNHAARISK